MRNIAFASFALIVLATPHAHAAPMGVAVRYGDLNLASADGRHVLQRRLAAAARKVCGPATDLRSPRLPSYQACVSDAVARATAQTDQRRLADAAR